MNLKAYLIHIRIRRFKNFIFFLNTLAFIDYVTYLQSNRNHYCLWFNKHLEFKNAAIVQREICLVFTILTVSSN